MSSNKIAFLGLKAGRTCCGVVETDAGQAWNGSALETWDATHIASYGVSPVVLDAAAHGEFTVPAGLPAGDNYQVTIYDQAGGSLASSDWPVTEPPIRFRWSGSSLVYAATAAEVWANPGRTLTVPVVGAPSALVSGQVAVLRGDDFSAPIQGLGSLSGRSELWFTAKIAPTAADSQAIVQLTEAGGLLVLNGGAPGSSSNGSLTVTDASAGDVTIALDSAATSLLVPGSGTWDIQARISGTVRTLASGPFLVVADITRAI